MAPQTVLFCAPKTKQSTTHEQHLGGVEGGRAGQDGCERVRETEIEREGERLRCGIVGGDKE